MSEVAFWDQTWEEKFKPFAVGADKFPDDYALFFKNIGDVKGKSILDLGCGNGELSVYLARQGALVLAVDTSNVSLINTKALAEFNGVQVRTKNVSALELGNLNEKYDVIVGSFILHHIEPFGQFVNILFRLMKENSRAVFYENSSRNKLLMFFRNNFVGKYGIPKYGDAEEYPLEVKEVDIIKKRFDEDKVSVLYPKFFFFEMLAPYIFKHNRILRLLFLKIDSFFYNFYKIRKYRYYQIIVINK